MPEGSHRPGQEKRTILRQRIEARRLWQALCRSRRGVPGLSEATGAVGFRIDPASGLVPVAAGEGPAPADLVRSPDGGVTLAPNRVAGAAAERLAGLFGPLVLRPPGAALVLAHLGQSVDGRIATESGHSHYIGGTESLEHLHRLRALVDVVVIGAETACLDRPRLTVRRVPGDNPVRAVIDPRARLPADCPLLTDGQAPTLVLRPRTAAAPAAGRLSAQTETLPVAADPDGSLAPAAILAALAERGLHRVLVEGGGGTVSRFLAAGCLHRLQLAVAPLIIGSGRPVLTLPVIAELGAALRPACRTWPLGDDVLFAFTFEPSAQDHGSANRS